MSWPLVFAGIFVCCVICGIIVFFLGIYYINKQISINVGFRQVFEKFDRSRSDFMFYYRGIDIDKDVLDKIKKYRRAIWILNISGIMSAFIAQFIMLAS